MKTMFFFLGSFCSMLCAYSPSADFIIAEMAKRCVVGKAQFNGIMNEGPKAHMLNLSLRSDGLFITKARPVVATAALPQATDEVVNLFVLQNLVSCRDQGTKKIKEYLAAQGVDLTKVGHGLFKYAPVYIIGADASETKAPQIWIEKQNFTPVIEKGANRTVTFENWVPVRQLADKKWPSIINTTVNGKESKLVLTASTEMPPRK